MRLRRVRRLHRQPHGRRRTSREALFLLEEGASRAADRRARSRSSAWRWASSRWATSPAATSAGRSASAGTPRTRSAPRSPIADRLCEMGRFGQKTGAGYYRYEAGSRDALRDPVVDERDRRVPQGGGDHAAQGDRRGDRRSAASTRWSTRARGSWRRASRSAPPTSTWSTSWATASRRTAAARCSTPTRSGLIDRRARDGALRAATRARTQTFWQPGAAARAARGRRQDVQLTRRDGRTVIAVEQESP